MLKMKGFPDKWIDWVMETIRGGEVCVKVNENLGKYFITHKGLRQGESLSPLNFDLADAALAIMLDKARENGLVKGVLNEYIQMGLICYNMHDLCFDKKKTVKEVFDNGLDNVQFRRTLLGDAREL